MKRTDLNKKLKEIRVDKENQDKKYYIKYQPPYGMIDALLNYDSKPSCLSSMHDMEG